MPQRLIAALPTSLHTERQRQILQWLSSTPSLGTQFADSQGNPTPLPWNEYTDVNPSAGAASVSTLCEFTKIHPNYRNDCGASDAYSTTLRVTIGMANILSARELTNDLIELLDARLAQGMDLSFSYGGQERYDRYKWVRGTSKAWAITKDIKGNEAGAYPGGKVTAMGLFLIEPKRG